MRLIDGDALIAWIKGSQQMTSKMKSLICYIKTMPTIDAVSVVHGKWIKRHGTINCSVCKRSNWSACFEDTVRSFNFCPNCGAKMDGERKESE